MKGCGNGFPCHKKKTCHMFSFTPLLRKTRPISGRVVPCEGTKEGGEGVSYGFFPCPRLEEVKRAYCGVYNILFEVTILNLA